MGKRAVKQTAPRLRAQTHRQQSEPYIALVDRQGHTVHLPINLPLSAIRDRVAGFVKHEQAAKGTPIRRGRRKGALGSRKTEGSAMILAYLQDFRHIKPSVLLRLCRREPSPENFHWLKRRVTSGRTRGADPIGFDMAATISDDDTLVRILSTALESEREGNAPDVTDLLRRANVERT